MADNLTADINELYIIGRMSLPMMGNIYGKVNNAVAATADSEQPAFTVTAGGPPSQITSLWQSLRDDLQNILGHSAENLFSAGQTVIHIADLFEQTDTDSGKALLQSYWAGGTPPSTAGQEHIPAEEPPAIRITR
ncbi:hypothetical protein Acy02nite_46960 [Actinoplanes cyaneus]|uniref:Uncharacterized protein n=1 Tax=Actinoplanes cyaneus TaxID=52696 RepID=A0A919M232_9ACTN|nr:hypothetical protein [Actinoplanes cyaneus]MCW2138848.1 hypothetical protein [Actinoplanes cyaneus]GID66815.1 hypothetical protein Acy02nite_46960 [Actinoplanes cyaneus]